MGDCYYLELEFLEDKSELPLPTLMRLLPESLRERARTRYIENRLPLLERSMALFGREGMAVRLPYVQREFAAFSREKQEAVVLRTLGEYPDVPVSAPPQLERLLSAERAPKGIHLMSAFIEPVCRQLLREQKISKKEMKLVCMDRPDVDIIGLLEKWKQDLNFLTIVTDDAERYREFAERLFDDTGLLVSFLKRPLTGMAEGNVVLDFGRGEEKEYLCYPKGASIVDLSGDPERMRPITARRKDIRYYNRLYLTAGGTELDAGLVEAALGIAGILTENDVKTAQGVLVEHGANFGRVGVKRFL